MEEKSYPSANEFLLDSFRLAKKIYDSGFKPDFILAVWREGASVGIAVHEFMAWKGLEPDHMPIRATAYHDIDELGSRVEVYGLDYVTERLTPETKLLIVDDVFDRGVTMKKIIDVLKSKCKHSFPKTLKTAVVYYKPKKNQTDMKPDFYLHETDKWVMLPNSIQGLTDDELIEKNKELSEILDVK